MRRLGQPPRASQAGQQVWPGGAPRPYSTDRPARLAGPGVRQQISMHGDAAEKLDFRRLAVSGVRLCLRLWRSLPRLSRPTSPQISVCGDLRLRPSVAIHRDTGGDRSLPRLSRPRPGQTAQLRPRPKQGPALSMLQRHLSRALRRGRLRPERLGRPTRVTSVTRIPSERRTRCRARGRTGGSAAA